MTLNPVIYYSLDIETSGFDPEKNEILEVGFVKFSAGKNGLKVLGKWTRVFKPTAPVSAHVLGLTGISQKELDGGADFEAHRQFLQSELGAANIVGHNVGFDIRFLEKNGLKFSGLVVDTMDLVQILLPTHHSYNLENLMHYFAVPHTEAHRALADSQAVIRLLERLLGLYYRLPEKTKDIIEILASKAHAPWLDLLRSGKTAERSLPQGALKVKPAFVVRLQPTELADQSIYFTQSFADPVDTAAALVGQTTEPLLIVVPRRHQVLQIWKQGLVRGLFTPRFRFREEAWQALLRRDDLTPEESRFAMKTAVWRATNWQTEYLIDLNLSFSGGQFRESLAGDALPRQFQERVLCCDQETFLAMKGHHLLRDRSVVIFGLGDFEKAIAATLGQRSSWGHISYLLKSIYNPELGTGLESARETVSQTLADVDLFFGLASVLLSKLKSGSGDIVVDDGLRNSHEFVQVVKAAGHFVEKLRLAAASLGSSEIAEYATALQNFFKEEPGYVKWVFIDELKCVFHNLPLDISGIVREYVSSAKKICFLESCGERRVVTYFSRRLGLKDFTEHEFAQRLPKGRLNWLFKRPKRPANCNFLTQPSESSVMDVLLSKKAFPAALVMDSVQDISDFYKKYYDRLQQLAYLLVQQADGGSNKLFHNFTIYSNSLLLVTGKGILRFLRNPQQVRPVDHVKVKTLVLAGLSDAKSNDPYSRVLSRQFKNPDDEYFLPKSLYDLYSILQFFHSSDLKNIYVYIPEKPNKHKDIYVNFLSEFFGV